MSQSVEKDVPSQEVRVAWEQAHDVFCPRQRYCSTHLRPGDRHLLAHVFPRPDFNHPDYHTPPSRPIPPEQSAP